MSTQPSDRLIGPSGDPPPFARSHTATPRGETGVLPTATWRPLIQQVCDRWEAGPIRAEAMMLLESAGQDLEPNRDGAVGLMQIIPSIWPELCAAVCEAHGVPNTLASVRRSDINVEIGVRELTWWIEQKCGGDADGGSCAYFSGHCVPNGAKDAFGTTDHQYVEIVRQNMTRIRADMGGVEIPEPPVVEDPVFNDGDRIEVIDGPLNLRDRGNLQSSIVDSLAAGAAMVVTGGPVHHDGYAWYRVELAEGSGKGWVAGRFCHLSS